jgi:signal peptidase
MGETEERVSAHFDIITREILSRGKCLRFQAHGQSMYPLIRNGNIVVIEPGSAAALNIGDIVFYRRPWGTYVVHRLIKKGKKATHLIMKGDNLTYYDEPVLAEQVMGRAIRIESQGSYVICSGLKGRLLGWLIAWFSHCQTPAITRLTRHLGRFYWILGKRRLAI